MDNLSDEQLVEAYRQGQNQALEALIRRHLERVFRLAFSYLKDQAEAEDVTQDSFIKAWKNIKNYDSEYRFQNWLLTITKNTALDYIKKKRPATFSYLANIENFNPETYLSDNRSGAFESIALQEDYQALKLALTELVPAQKQTIELHYLDGYKFREIATTFKESINTVKTRNLRAIGNLRRLLTK
jgi:RNA polymerase sigma-70 factor (ECF subfamily)